MNGMHLRGEVKPKRSFWKEEQLDDSYEKGKQKSSNLLMEKVYATY